MPAGINPNGQLVVETVTQNPGKLTRDDIIALFKPEQEKSVRLSLGRLLGPYSGKLKEENGFLFPGDGPTSDNEGSDEDENEQSATDIIPQESTLLTLPWAHEESIDLPDVAKNRNIDVVFEVQLRVKAAKRIGISNIANKNSIIWLPPGAAILKVKLGEFELVENLELMNQNYLCIVVRKNDSYVVRYYRAPQNEKFALAWEEERE